MAEIDNSEKAPKKFKIEEGSSGCLIPYGEWENIAVEDGNIVSGKLGNVDLTGMSEDQILQEIARAKSPEGAQNLSVAKDIARFINLSD